MKEMKDAFPAGWLGALESSPNIRPNIHRMPNGRIRLVQLCLATSVDAMVHNGALVNHAFTYEQLFEPNVLGSVEVSSGLFSLVLTRSLTPCWWRVLAAASPMSGKDLPRTTHQKE